jgi:hypothetical protein
VWGTTVLTGQTLNAYSILWAGTGAAWVDATNIVWGTSTLPSSLIQPMGADDGDQ